jgi:hypothetical protein
MWAASIGYIQPPISLSRSYTPQSLNLSHHVPYLTGRDSAPDACCPRYWILRLSRICSACIVAELDGTPPHVFVQHAPLVNLGETFHSFLSSVFSPYVNPWVCCLNIWTTQFLALHTARGMTSPHPTASIA